MLLFVQDFHFVLLFYVLQHLILIFSDIDECSSNPCQNLGTCNGGVNMYTCTCAAGYTGDNCETGEITAFERYNQKKFISTSLTSSASSHNKSFMLNHS